LIGDIYQYSCGYHEISGQKSSCGGVCIWASVSGSSKLVTPICVQLLVLSIIKPQVAVGFGLSVGEVGQDGIHLNPRNIG